MKNKKAITLMELLVVIVIIGILATVAITHYRSTVEKVLDKEAVSNLKLVRAAQISYKMDTGSYYTSSSISSINNTLRLSISAGTNRKWDYAVFSSGCGCATRNGGDGRIWYLTISDADEEPDSGASCCP